MRPVGGQESTQDIEKDIMCGHENIKHSTRTARPAGGQTFIQHTEKFVKSPPWRKSSTLIFRVLGLSHAVVNEAETFPRSRACQKDRKSSSSRSTSSRLAAE